MKIVDEGSGEREPSKLREFATFPLDWAGLSHRNFRDLLADEEIQKRR